MAMMSSYQEPADWFKKRLAEHGFYTNEVVLDPYTERWMFYEDETFVLAVPHDVMDYVMGKLLYPDGTLYALRK